MGEAIAAAAVAAIVGTLLGAWLTSRRERQRRLRAIEVACAKLQGQLDEHDRWERSEKYS